jgi:hypothetical protein
VVRARPLEELLKVVRLALGGHLLALSLGSGHERVITPLLVLLLLRVVGGAFTGVVVPLCLALGPVKNCFDRLLARGMVVVMSWSSLVVLGRLCPSLWTRDS